MIVRVARRVRPFVAPVVCVLFEHVEAVSPGYCARCHDYVTMQYFRERDRHHMARR